MIFYISIFICLLGGVQGIMLTLALKKLSDKHSGDFKWLIAFVLVVSLTLAGRILFLFPYQFDPRWSILTDLVIFIYGPLFYFFIQSTFGILNGYRKLRLHLIPGLIHVIIILPQFIVSSDDYAAFTNSKFWPAYVFCIIIAATIHNIWYWIKSHQFLKKQIPENISDSAVGQPNYIVFAKWTYALIIIMLSVSSLLISSYYIVAINLYQLSWILASWLIYGMTYYVLINPETFGDYLLRTKLQQNKNDKEQKQLDGLAVQLKIALEEHKIYTDPEISLVSLAHQMSTNNVMLSKTINKKFNSNFYDLINQYRVKEFIDLAKNQKNSHLTYFGLALKAGINSKTSFNKYFKKYTAKTPKEYFGNLTKK